MPALAAGVFDRRDHFDKPVFHRHFDAEAREFALYLNLKVGVSFRIHIVGMGIEAKTPSLRWRRRSVRCPEPGAHRWRGRVEGFAKEIKLAVGTRTVGTLRCRQHSDRDNEADAIPAPRK